MNLRICGIEKARQLISEGWPTQIISIINSQIGMFPATHIEKQMENHHIWSFHDVEVDDPAEYSTFTPPTKEIIQEILQTLKSFDPNKPTLIHCSAGKSRSTAIALAWLYENGYSVEDGLAFIQKQSPAMIPNRLMVKLFDDAMGANGGLIEPLQKWYKSAIWEFNELEVKDGK